MKWMKHSRLDGQHAFLSASKNSWLNYSEDKLVEAYYSFLATQRGTRLHELAEKLISEGVYVLDDHKTFSMYVNDAIDKKLRPEQKLYFSDNCFGTADAINFDERRGILTIHDLKTGITPAHIRQLEIYAALFFLEYDIPVNDVKTELRIYQNDDIIEEHPTVEDIAPIIDKIITSDEIIEQIKKENDDEL